MVHAPRPGTVVGAGDTEGSQKDKALALKWLSLVGGDR